MFDNDSVNRSQRKIRHIRSMNETDRACTAGAWSMRDLDLSLLAISNGIWVI